MQAVESVIIEKKEKEDRTFVCVAFSRGRVLITNDGKHITWGASYDKPKPTKKCNRCTRLMKATKKHRTNGAALMASVDAHSSL